MGADDLFVSSVLVLACVALGFLLWYFPVLGLAALTFMLTTGYLTYCED